MNNTFAVGLVLHILIIIVQLTAKLKLAVFYQVLSAENFQTSAQMASQAQVAKILSLIHI